MKSGAVDDGKMRDKLAKLLKTTQPSFEKEPIWSGRENICETVGECEHLDNSERDDEDDYDEDGGHHHDWEWTGIFLSSEFVCFVAEDRQTDGQTEERTYRRRDRRSFKHSDDITGIGIEMGWDLREDGSPQDACSIIMTNMLLLHEWVDFWPAPLLALKSMGGHGSEVYFY